jgi:hypothetical protein
MDVDNYTPPSQEPPPAGNDTTLVVHEPRVVVGDRGAAWLTEAWDMFKAAPGAWLALCIVGVVVWCVINLVPFLNIINGLLQPVWGAGLLLAVHAQRNGEPVKVNHLFAGFGPKAGRLVLSGVAAGLVGLIIVGVTLGPFIVELVQSPDPQGALLDQNLNSLLLRILIVVALTIPVYAAVWFAPALIIFGNMGVQQALLLSLKACMKNMWPFFIYSLCLLVLGVLAVFTVGIALLVIIPMFYMSLYLSFRDIFID